MDRSGFDRIFVRVPMLELLGPKLRKQRRRLGLTLDELAGRTGISKPYLSLIETGRVPNPPSDEKLRKLEQTLGFGTGELVTQAHLQRTPHDVRAMLQRLMQGAKPEPQTKAGTTVGVDLDNAYMTGILQQLVEHSATNVETISTNAVPVITLLQSRHQVKKTGTIVQ